MLRRPFASACVGGGLGAPGAMFPAAAAIGATAAAPLGSLRCDAMRHKKVTKARKRPQPSPKYVKDSQVWREKWTDERVLNVAESFRSYVTYATNRRQAPYDNRFAPFDRVDNDGAYIVMKHMMDDPLRHTNNHAPPTKKLLFNVGLLGPLHNPHVRMWKPVSYAALPESATLAEARGRRLKDVNAGVYSDPTAAV